MDPRQLRIAAVVVTYNRKNLLRECLTALCCQTRSLEKIIIVDNASTDGTGEMTSSEFPFAKHVSLPENIGGAGGFYEGMKLANELGYDWVWLMDDDAKPDADALNALLQPSLLQDPSIYALTSTVLNPDRSVSLIDRRLLRPPMQTPQPVARNFYTGKEEFELDLATFVGVLISHRAIVQVGLPLKEFFIYSDDFEYSLRIRASGGRILNIPTSRIEHNSGQARDKSPFTAPLSWRSYYMRRNLIFTYKKYGFFGLMSFIRLILKTARTQIGVLLWRKQKLESTRLLWYAIIHGLTGRLGKSITPR